MDGLLIHLLRTGKDEPRFWKIFGSIRQELDRFYWCFLNQPWMSDPVDFDEKSVLMRFEEDEYTSTLLWKPGNFSRYGNKFREEFLEFWAIEPTGDDPQNLTEAFEKTKFRDRSKFIEKHACIWMLFTDSTSWEIFAQKPGLLERLQDSLSNQPSVKVYKTQSGHRGRAFGIAGLSHVWKNLQG
jgi:hypothetical protein